MAVVAEVLRRSLLIMLVLDCVPGGQSEEDTLFLLVLVHREELLLLRVEESAKSRFVKLGVGL